MVIRIAVKRKLIQVAAFGITNAKVSNFATGGIDQGNLKSVCVPGLNCYSCPGAIASCPIGSLQAVMGSYRYHFSFYVVGILMAFGIVLGRFICGFLCPFGLVQEVIHKIPSPKISLHRIFTYFKYVVLVVFVLAMPVLITNYMGMGQPAFCQYICPAGTLGAGWPLLSMNDHLRNTIGWLFSLKSAILILIIILCVFIYRFFCKALCPLGAIYALFNRFSLYQLKLNPNKCVHCGICKKVCRMEVDPSKNPTALECIRCGDCVEACPTKALEAGFGISFRRKDTPKKSGCSGCPGHASQGHTQPQ